MSDTKEFREWVNVQQRELAGWFANRPFGARPSVESCLKNERQKRLRESMEILEQFELQSTGQN